MKSKEGYASLPDLTTVAVVLDPEYGRRDETIQSEMPVWIVRSPTNEVAYDWRRSISANSAIFEVRDAEGREENRVGVLGDIDDHFGSWSTTNHTDAFK